MPDRRDSSRSTARRSPCRRAPWFRRPWRMAGVSQFRRSVSGEPRGPLCGMGICFECRVTIGGRAHCRSCQEVCRPGMEVRTDG